MIRAADDFDVIRGRLDTIRAEEICARAEAAAQREKEGRALLPVPVAPAPAIASEHVMVGWEEPDTGAELRPPGDDKHAFEGWIEKVRLPIGHLPKNWRNAAYIVAADCRDDAELTVQTSDGATETLPWVEAPEGQLTPSEIRAIEKEEAVREKYKASVPVARWRRNGEVLVRSCEAGEIVADVAVDLTDNGVWRKVNPALEEVFARLRGHLDDCEAGVVVNGEYGACVLPAPPNLGKPR